MSSRIFFLISLNAIPKHSSQLLPRRKFALVFVGVLFTRRNFTVIPKENKSWDHLIKLPMTTTPKHLSGTVIKGDIFLF